MDLNRLVKEELSGSTAKSFVEKISGFHRVQASTTFHEAAEYVKSELLKMGFEDAVIEQFPSDGSKKYWTYTSPIGWEVKSAELRLMEPEERLLARFEDVPTCLHTYSNATPPEGVIAEVVDVGAGTKARDYDGKDVKGKFVLATGRARLVHEQAVYRFGAVGVITDTLPYEMKNVRESVDVPDAFGYQSIWPTAEELGRVAFGFSITKRQGNYLRSLLRDGKTVKLKAKVEARLFPGKLDVVTATLRGSLKPNEEVFLIAHLCHPKPSANDNASGSGLLLEIARTIKKFVDSSRIAPPARTLRFLWVPETFGTVAYLSSHEESLSKFVAGINLDMVGQDQEMCKSTLQVDCTPDSLPSYLNDFVLNLVEQSIREFDVQTAFGSASTFRYRANAFSGGSDHAEFNSSTVGVPCVMLLQWPDLYYHTSMDTIDKVSVDSLRRIGWIATVAALTLANASAEEILLLAGQTATRSIERIEEASREALNELFKKSVDPKLKGKPAELAKELAKTFIRFKDKMEHIIWREQEAVKSVKRLGEKPEFEAFLNNYCSDIANMGQKEIARLETALNFIARSLNLKLPAEIEATAAEEELKRLVPKKLFKGTLYMEALRSALGEEYEWYEEIGERDMDFDKKEAEILNFIDGKRSAYDILKAVSAEYSETNPEHMLKFLRDLEKTGFITFASKDEASK
ncbi:MAG: DUF4910 domain-containing protein [Candidatus Bathyarchaeia archaeon]